MRGKCQRFQVSDDSRGFHDGWRWMGCDDFPDVSFLTLSKGKGTMARTTEKLPTQGQILKLAKGVTNKYAASVRLETMSKLAGDEDEEKALLHTASKTTKESADREKGKLQSLVMKVMENAETPEDFEKVIQGLVGIFPQDQKEVEINPENVSPSPRKN